MVRNIVFDIGNVLADFRWREYLDGYRLTEEQDAVVAGHLFMSPMWKEIDRGAKPDQELLWTICSDVSQEMEKLIRLVYRGAGEAVKENRYAAKLLETLKEQGYKIYILSNYGKTFFEEKLAGFEFMQFVDGRVISYEVNAIKPEPEIYKALLNRYHLDPEECLFFDDLAENVEAARAFGMLAVQVTDGYDSIREGLERYGIEG